MSGGAEVADADDQVGGGSDGFVGVSTLNVGGGEVLCDVFGPDGVERSGEEHVVVHVEDTVVRC